MTSAESAETAELNQYYDEIIDEFNGFRDTLSAKVQRIQEVRATLIDDLESQFTKLKAEKAQFEKEMKSLREQ